MLQGRGSFRYTESSPNSHQETGIRANPLHHLAAFGGDNFSSTVSPGKGRPFNGKVLQYSPGTGLGAENTAQATLGAGKSENDFFLIQRTSVSLYSRTMSIPITTSTYRPFLCL